MVMPNILPFLTCTGDSFVAPGTCRLDMHLSLCCSSVEACSIVASGYHSDLPRRYRRCSLIGPMHSLKNGTGN